MYILDLKRIFTIVFISSIVFVQCGCSSLKFKTEYDNALSFYNQKKYNEAIISLNNALVYKPDSYSALCLLGASYTYNKDIKLAEKTFQEAINLYPNNWNAFVLLADLKRSQKDYEHAIDYYETATTLESMQGDEKIYYKKLIKQIKDEQMAYQFSDPMAKQKSVEMLKAEIVNSYTGQRANVNNTLQTAKQTGEVFLHLDKTKWEKAIEQKDEKSHVVEYGLKGEDVKNFKWTQLATVQYFILNDNFKTTLDSYYKKHIGAIDAIAKNSSKLFEKKIISQSKTEIIYEWTFDNAKESELARIIYTPKGIYHIHFAKKGAFSNEEKAKYIDILKSAILK